MALRAAQKASQDLRGATAYVTLEPCAHHGRTPPCCDVLMKAGIAKVILAQAISQPAGGWPGHSPAAGIEVNVLDPDDLVAITTLKLNIGFFSRMLRKTLWYA